MAAPTLTWEIAQSLGLCAVAGCLVLCVLAVRPRAGASSTFRLPSHELLGWLVLAAAGLHVALLVGADRRVIEHLKPTAPRYELAGILALLTLLFLTVPAGAGARRRLWPRHRNFQAAHVVAACLLLVTVAMHVLTTDRYVHGRAHGIAYMLLSAAALLALLRGRARRPEEPRPPRLGGLVFGRHSRLVMLIVLGSLLVLAALTRGGAGLALREPFLRRSEPLVLAFPHALHRAVNCVVCHHDYLDRSGEGSCISCHRTSTAIRVGAEARFHDFCLGCHRDPPAGLAVHGPVTGCDTCHYAAASR